MGRMGENLWRADRRVGQWRGFLLRRGCWREPGGDEVFLHVLGHFFVGSGAQGIRRRHLAALKSSEAILASRERSEGQFMVVSNTIQQPA
jgi:hypothetical protein